MSRSSTAAAGVLAAALLTGSGALVAPSPAEAAPPGMPDPRQMSGLSRPDPALAPGVLTVRCLLGGFSEPAVDVEVTPFVHGRRGHCHGADRRGRSGDV